MIISTAVGFSAAAAAFLLVGVLSIVSWRGGRIGGFLIIACGATVLWAGVLAANLFVGPLSVAVLLANEVVHVGIWLAFLAVLLARQGFTKSLLWFVHASWLVVLLLILASLMFPFSISDWILGASTGLLAGVFLSLLGLFLLEQLLKNSSRDERESVMPLAIGLGGIFGFDLFLYSEAYLFGGYDASSWAARGYVNALSAAAIAFAARRNSDWDIDLFVSRHVVFYTTTLSAVGLYLIVVALGGFLLQQFGGELGGLVRGVFVAGALLVLFALLSSNVLRIRVKMFLSKHFYRNRYDYREEWMRLVETIGSAEDVRHPDVMISALCDIIESPGGIAWRLDADGKRFVFAGSYLLEEQASDLSADDELLKFIAETGWIVDLDEYQVEPSTYHNAALPACIRQLESARLIVPLQARGVLYGLVALSRPAGGRFQMNYEDRDILKTAGNHIAIHLSHQLSESALIEARQFEAYNRLTAFLMHDLSNLLAQQSLIVKNAEVHRANPEFIDDALKTVANSVNRMNRLMKQLKNPGSFTEKRPTRLRYILSAAIDRCADHEPLPTLKCDDGDQPIAVDAERFISVIAHLLRNAQDATNVDGQIELTGSIDTHAVVVDVEDTGSGMSNKFVSERLFKPFDSTKGAVGMGIGVYQAREFARSLGGDLIAASVEGKGTRFTMTVSRDKVEPNAELVGAA